MPQLDFLILSSQTSFVIFFWFGYFLFIKNILPLLSIELKSKQKFVYSNILWLKNNVFRTLFFSLPFGRLLTKTKRMIFSVDFIVLKKNIFFGIYNVDLLYIKDKLQKMK
jgi:hypothetical protein